MNPRTCLYGWYKDHPHSDHAHRILRYDRDLLISQCGRVIPVREAVAVAQSVPCCMECARIWMKEKRKRL
jgi:hypothetical protein